MLAERIGYLRAPGGWSAGFWWLVRRAARLEYDRVLECRLDQARSCVADPAPFRLGCISGPPDLACIPPGVLEQLERHTWTSIARHVDAGERVYYLADGDQVVCQLNVAYAPRVRVGAPIPGWFELPSRTAYQSYTYTHEGYRRHGAARRLYALMHDDLVRLGVSSVFCLVSRTNVPQLCNVAGLGYRPVAAVWATRGGRLLYGRGLGRLGVRYLPDARPQR